MPGRFHTALVLAALIGALGAAPQSTADTAFPLPHLMADTGGGDQLITAVALGPSHTAGTLTWWERRRSGRWARVGSAPARFGTNGLVEGDSRTQGTSTTPSGLYDLPYAFGIEPAPAGTSYPYRPVGADSWWCQDNSSVHYNRWVEPRPADCAPHEAEHLITYPQQYARALVIGFNYAQPVQGRGAGIFLHVDGEGTTAGCVSVPAEAMERILLWADQEEDPHIAIGSATGPLAVTRY
ncbi:L,D-transpeptidase [Streptomyces sp. NPDC006879]|uniref:L,D-transpeptidase family protein n=1 Tax=Streptomyces sp. NPDC006879 TaxID=3364767 RepID=UPI0036C2B38C